MQEILLSCIFLFVKHPFDVGDLVQWDDNSYVVAKMNLMSTSFKRIDGKYVWVGHNVLSTKVIENGASLLVDQSPDQVQLGGPVLLRRHSGRSLVLTKCFVNMTSASTLPLTPRSKHFKFSAPKCFASARKIRETFFPCSTWSSTIFLDKARWY